MTSPKKLKKVLPAFKVNMGGIILDQALPQKSVDMIDPFLLVHHLEHKFDPNTAQASAGVPPHPHRGFAPVSFVFKGGVHHRDSTNVSSVVYPGGTQWMHAGRGIVHSERPAKEVAEAGESWELIQFWVNAPAKYKMSEPKYVGLQKDNTPTVCLSNDNVEVGVVAGEFQDLKGPIDTFTPIMALRLTFAESGEVDIPVPASFNGFVYLLDGALTYNNETNLVSKDLAWLSNEGEIVTLKATKNTRAILLAGEPINEPVATYGPFVMNEQSEVMQAMRDYQVGKMGSLEEVFE